MRLHRVILGETSESGQKVAIGKLALDNICWVDTIEHKRLTIQVLKVIRGPSPIELDSWGIFPSSVRWRLVLSPVDKESLRPVRESWVTPFLIYKCLIDDLLPGNISQSGRFIGERIGPVLSGAELSEQWL
jgi:hypothetical protein